MATPKAAPRPSSGLVQIVILVAVVVAMVDFAFYVISDIYLDDKLKTNKIVVGFADDECKAWWSYCSFRDPRWLSHMRWAFAVFTGSVGLLTIATAVGARWVGHGLALITGPAAFIAAYFAWQSDASVVMPVTLAVLGVLFPALALLSFWSESRAAWSFLVAACFTLAVVTFFGASKLRNTLTVNLFVAMIIPGVLAVAGVALTRLRRMYRDRR